MDLLRGLVGPQPVPTVGDPLAKGSLFDPDLPAQVDNREGPVSGKLVGASPRDTEQLGNLRDRE
jgi:hypothetical protein